MLWQGLVTALVGNGRRLVRLLGRFADGGSGWPGLEPRSGGLPRSGLGPPLQGGCGSAVRVLQPRSRGFSRFGFSHKARLKPNCEKPPEGG